MAKNYSFEKGKYGNVTGTIVPFGRYLDGSDPAGFDWTKYVPAGYLRCNGGIFRARDYRALAEVLGIGQACKYRKDDVELEEADDTLSEGQFQLPDLGSKYVKSSTASGTYQNLLILNPITGEFTTRSGLAVEIELNQGEELETPYSGTFTVPNTEIEFSDNQNFATTLPGNIPDATVQFDNLLAHGHLSNAAVVRRNEDSENVATWSGDLKTGYTVNQEITQSSVEGSEEGTEHNHSLERSSISKNLSSNIDTFSLPADQIITTTRINSSNTYKMDDLNHKYILVEYLIKT